VHHMAHPKQVDLVAQPMRPIVGQINQNKAKRPKNEGTWQLKTAEITKQLKHEHVRANCKHLGKYTRHLVNYATRNIRKRIIQPVTLALLDQIVHELNGDQRKENRDTKNYNIQVQVVQSNTICSFQRYIASHEQQSPPEIDFTLRIFDP